MKPKKILPKYKVIQERLLNSGYLVSVPFNN